MYFLLATLTSFLIGFLVTPILIPVLEKARIGDNPGGRKIHKKFTPSMGGIVFAVASFVSLGIWGWQFPLPDIKYLFGAISLMFFVGLRDDLVPLKANHKILGQLIAVVLVVALADIRIKDLNGFLGIWELNILISYAFSSFVLLALTNSFNLIDGIDGLAGSMAVLVFSFLGIWFYGVGLESLALLSFTFLGVVLAFLIFNWSPAKIFMGDTGSLTLGFTLGALIIAFMEYNAALPKGNSWKFEPVFSAGIALMIFPLYDMARVFAKRIAQGKSPMEADKSHVHHFLLRMGLKHNQVTLLLVAVQLIFILLILSLKNLSDHIALPLISILALGLGFRLDQISLKYVKRKVWSSPNVLDEKEKSLRVSSKIKLKKKDFKHSKINVN
jgi:UDP-N-acetylmuramyl pentapeptide phosphotransferase/UDP-N-acetylglucosamine-1-phosphate transferase